MPSPNAGSARGCVMPFQSPGSMDQRSTLATLLVFATLALGPALQAQTYYYINAISVTPAAPTVQDAVQLVLDGDLSNSGSFVASATAAVSGTAVTLTVDAQSTGGLDVLVPHTQTITVGQLPAGTYTVTINGSAVLDSAPAAQHQFTVTGGAPTACDSLVLASISWAPFTDTALMVHVFNATSELFDYPAFVVLGNSGDTLAKETVNFFGIGQESWHLLTIRPGAVVPDGPFTGRLELWKLFNTVLACSWDRTFDLCPPGPCAPFNAMIENDGKSLVDGTFQYTIKHLGSVVANGAFTLNASTTYASDSLCLPPGHYMMEVVADQGLGNGEVRFGVGIGNVILGPTAYVVPTTLSAVGFDYYAPCANGPQAVAETRPAGMVVAQNAGFLTVARADGRPIGDLWVMDAQGRMVAHAVDHRGLHGLATAGWAHGLYLLRGEGTDGQVFTARVVIP